MLEARSRALNFQDRNLSRDRDFRPFQESTQV